MIEKKKAIFCWSGGKDSAYCLHKILGENEYEVKYLLTTLNLDFKRISMHGIREELLDAQVESIGIPLIKVWVSEGSNEEYEKKMNAAFTKAKNEGIDYVLFGDIFLEDLRVYRENSLVDAGMKAIFPLWKMNTALLLDDFINQGFKSVICCTNDGYLGEVWLGRELDSSFENQLPPNVDPCGENGEYHTFCYDGPLFRHRIHFSEGEKVYKKIVIQTSNDCDLPSEPLTKGFWFCDLLPIVTKPVPVNI